MAARKERRMSPEEDRQLYRESLKAHGEYMAIHGKYMASQTDLLPTVQRDVAETKALVSKAMIILVGNGDTSNSVCTRLLMTEREIKTIKQQIIDGLAEMDKRLSAILGTDNWRRDILIKAISTVTTAVIIFFLLQKFGK